MCAKRMVLVAVVAVGCGGGGGGGEPDAGPGIDAPVAEPDAPVCQADTRPQAVYHGTTLPTYVPLTEGQIMAIGAWTGSPSGGSIVCSGTLIAPEWVLTADHCGIGNNDYFCFGPDADNPVGCLGVAEVHTKPQTTEGQLDMTIARLEQDATVAIPGVEPILVVVEPLPPYVGQLGETAGFGETELGTSGVQYFAVETIDDVGTENPQELVVNGGGQRGVCYGDSGGPAMIIDGDGVARVAGVLSWGDPSCVDRDRYTRADLALTWIETYTGATPPPVGAPCGDFDAVGRCSGERAIWCQDGTVASQECTTCGWDATAGGFRCIDGADSCQGYDRLGSCDGEIARWCDNGEPKARDCACLGQICTVDITQGGSSCIDDPCMGLDYLGECQGTVARWCESGTLREYDCAQDNRQCGWVDDQTGYWCI